MSTVRWQATFWLREIVDFKSVSTISPRDYGQHEDGSGTATAVSNDRLTVFFYSALGAVLSLSALTSRPVPSQGEDGWMVATWVLEIRVQIQKPMPVRCCTPSQVSIRIEKSGIQVKGCRNRLPRWFQARIPVQDPKTE